MTFCISWRIALFTLGLRTHEGGEEGSGSANIVTDGSGQNRSKGFYIEMWGRCPYLAADAV